METMTPTRQRESIVDKKFHLTFRDLVWIIGLILTATFFYFDSKNDDKESAELVEYKLNHLQMDQDKMNLKIDRMIDLMIEEKNNKDAN